MNIRLRQDTIVRHLRRNTNTTIAQLCEVVKASKRTVLRDLTALRDQGYLIHSDVGRGGGLCLDPQSIQTTARLSVEEVFALLISVASMRAVGSLPFSSLADTALAKIEMALPQDKVRDLRRFLACLYVGTLAKEVDITGMGEIDPSLLSVFEPAFLEQHCLQFHYRDAKGVETDRLVEPQAVLILPPLWYLVAWDRSRQAIRHFRMDRICAPEALKGSSFTRRHIQFDDTVRPVRPSGAADQ